MTLTLDCTTEHKLDFYSVHGCVGIGHYEVVRGSRVHALALLEGALAPGVGVPQSAARIVDLLCSLPRLRHLVLSHATRFAAVVVQLVCQRQ